MSKPKVYFWTETISIGNFVEIKTVQGQLQGVDIGPIELTAINYSIVGDLKIAGMEFEISGDIVEDNMTFQQKYNTRGNYPDNPSYPNHILSNIPADADIFINPETALYDEAVPTGSRKKTDLNWVDSANYNANTNKLLFSAPDGDRAIPVSVNDLDNYGFGGKTNSGVVAYFNSPFSIANIISVGNSSGVSNNSGAFSASLRIPAVQGVSSIVSSGGATGKITSAVFGWENSTNSIDIVDKLTWNDATKRKLTVTTEDMVGKMLAIEITNQQQELYKNQPMFKEAYSNIFGSGRLLDSVLFINVTNDTMVIDLNNLLTNNADKNIDFFHSSTLDFGLHCTTLTPDTYDSTKKYGYFTTSNYNSLHDVSIRTHLVTRGTGNDFDSSVYFLAKRFYITVKEEITKLDLSWINDGEMVVPILDLADKTNNRTVTVHHYNMQTAASTQDEPNITLKIIEDDNNFISPYMKGIVEKTVSVTERYSTTVTFGEDWVGADALKEMKKYKLIAVYDELNNNILLPKIIGPSIPFTVVLEKEVVEIRPDWTHKLYKKHGSKIFTIRTVNIAVGTAMKWYIKKLSDNTTVYAKYDWTVGNEVAGSNSKDINTNITIEDSQLNDLANGEKYVIAASWSGDTLDERHWVRTDSFEYDNVTVKSINDITLDWIDMWKGYNSESNDYKVPDIFDNISQRNDQTITFSTSGMNGETLYYGFFEWDMDQNDILGTIIKEEDENGVDTLSLDNNGGNYKLPANLWDVLIDGAGHGGHNKHFIVIATPTNENKLVNLTTVNEVADLKLSRPWTRKSEKEVVKMELSWTKGESPAYLDEWEADNWLQISIDAYNFQDSLVHFYIGHANSEETADWFIGETRLERFRSTYQFSNELKNKLKTLQDGGHVTAGNDLWIVMKLVNKDMVIRYGDNAGVTLENKGPWSSENMDNGKFTQLDKTASKIESVVLGWHASSSIFIFENGETFVNVRTLNVAQDSKITITFEDNANADLGFQRETPVITTTDGSGNDPDLNTEIKFSSYELFQLFATDQMITDGNGSYDGYQVKASIPDISPVSSSFKYSYYEPQITDVTYAWADKLNKNDSNTNISIKFKNVDESFLFSLSIMDVNSNAVEEIISSQACPKLDKKSALYISTQESLLSLPLTNAHIEKLTHNSKYKLIVRFVFQDDNDSVKNKPQVWIKNGPEFTFENTTSSGGGTGGGTTTVIVQTGYLTAVNGYYPLYTTKPKANSYSPGETSTLYTFNGINYWMPNNLPEGTYFSGTWNPNYLNAGEFELIHNTSQILGAPISTY